MRLSCVCGNAPRSAVTCPAHNVFTKHAHCVCPRCPFFNHPNITLYTYSESCGGSVQLTVRVHGHASGPVSAKAAKRMRRVPFQWSAKSTTCIGKRKAIYALSTQPFLCRTVDQACIAAPVCGVCPPRRQLIRLSHFTHQCGAIIVAQDGPLTCPEESTVWQSGMSYHFQMRGSQCLRPTKARLSAEQAIAQSYFCSCRLQRCHSRQHILLSNCCMASRNCS